MRTFLSALFFVAIALPTLAGPASERVFSTQALDLVKDNGQLVYTHLRNGHATEELNPLENAEIRIALRTGADGNREAVVTMGEVGKLRPVSVFPASSGNPLVPIFLESTLRTMARVTGGSAFYIRNRIKESLGTAGDMQPVELSVNGQKVAATAITFEPFLKDKNRSRMGAFADLKLRFVVAADLPGDVVSFTARTGDAEDPAYFEEISFQKLDGEN